jgi:hypothetical protein
MDSRSLGEVGEAVTANRAGAGLAGAATAAVLLMSAPSAGAATQIGETGLPTGGNEGQSAASSREGQSEPIACLLDFG